MVKIKRSFPASESLAEEAKKVNGKYDKPDVIASLKVDLQDPEKYLYFRVKNNDVNIEVADSADEVLKRTALLITETSSLKNTGMRTYASDERLRLLQKEMSLLYKQLIKLHKEPDSKVTLRTIRSLLSRESAFAAFKRCYVREHAAEYPRLQEYVSLET